MIFKIEYLPTVNAILNVFSTFFLLAAWVTVRRGKYIVHRNFIYAAMTTSALFLTSYLIHKFLHGPTTYAGKYSLIYYPILTSHTILAIVVFPMVLMTFRRGLEAQQKTPWFDPAIVKNRFAKHRRIARWTFPIWLYVSITGVIVYVMLYVL